MASGRGLSKRFVLGHESARGVSPREGISMLVLAPFAIVLQVAVAQPSPDSIKSVWEYYQKGQGKGPILADAVLCKTVEQKAKENKFECVEALGDSAAKGDTVNIWVAFLVPKDDTIETVTVQAVLDGQVRETKDLKLKGESMRTRTWTAFTLKKAGKWEFKIQDGEKTLKTLSINAS
jgi:hypothetical protein